MTHKQIQLREIMTMDEAAAYLGISRSGVEKLKNNGRLVFARVGGLIKFRRKDIDQFIEDSLVTVDEDKGRARL